MTNNLTDKWNTADQPWWKGAVIYQIYPRSFNECGEQGVGNLRGVAERMDYVAALGVDAVWLSPFFCSPMLDMGYDVSDYCDVDPLFGSLEDFDELIEAAHTRGLKVLIDLVLSHSSDQHPWFRESRQDRTNPRADWYVWADPKPDGSPPNNWLSLFGGSAWAWSSRRRQYFLHNFLPEQPDLNFHNPEVQAAVLDVAAFWLDRGVDGFRLDTVNFYFHDSELRDNPVARPDGQLRLAPDSNPYSFQEHVFDKSRPENDEFLRKFRRLIERYDGDRVLLGELGEDSSRALELLVDYTGDGTKLHMGYCFDLLYGELTAECFHEHIRRYDNCLRDTAWHCNVFSNHDVVRHISRWKVPEVEHDQAAKLCAGLLLSLRGSACLYQGEELGLPEPKLSLDELTDPYGIRFWPDIPSRDGCRTPIPWNAGNEHAGFSRGRPWLPVKPEHRRKAVDVQERDENSVLGHYRRLIAWRKAHPLLKYGSIDTLDTGDGILGIRRFDGKQALLLFFNPTNDTASVPLPSGWQCRSAQMPFDGVLSNGRLELPPYGAYAGYLAAE